MRRREQVPLYHVVLLGLAGLFAHFTLLRVADLVSQWIERAAGVRDKAAANEWRGQSQDERAEYATRNEVQGQVKALSDKQDISTAFADTAKGRDTGTSATWGYVIAGIGVALGLASLMVAVVVAAVTVILATR